MRTVCLFLIHLKFSKYLSLIRILKQVLNYLFEFRRRWQMKMKGNILFNNRMQFQIRNRSRNNLIFETLTCSLLDQILTRFQLGLLKLEKYCFPDLLNMRNLFAEGDQGWYVIFSCLGYVVLMLYLTSIHGMFT